MKKLLSLLGAIALTGSAATSVVACGGTPVEDETPTPPVEVDPVVNWTEEEFLENFGEFTYEKNLENTGEVKLTSTGNKTALFVDGDGTNIYTDSISLTDEIVILPNDVLPEVSASKPFSREIYTAITLDENVYNDAFNDPDLIDLYDFLEKGDYMGQLSKEKQIIIQNLLKYRYQFLKNTIEGNYFIGSVDTNSINQQDGEPLKLYYINFMVDFELLEFIDNLLQNLNSFFIDNDISNEFKEAGSENWIWWESTTGVDWMSNSFVLDGQGEKTNVEMLWDYLILKMNEINENILAKYNDENFNEKYLWNNVKKEDDEPSKINDVVRIYFRFERKDVGDFLLEIDLVNTPS